MSGPTSPRASVVIPAHDEAAVIADNLRTLLADARPGEFDVVVVCNGCSDDTADRARTVEGVRVREIAAASKIEALREGDRVTSTFPRIYLDADVALTTAMARALATALDEPGVAVAGIPGRFDLRRTSVPARLFLEFRQRLPVFRHGVLGGGVYALSAPGRRRWGVWPDVTGDDQFVYRSFAADERATVTGHHTVIDPPSDLRAVVRRGVRVRRGNRQLSEGGSDHAALSAPGAGLREAFREAVRTPRGLVSAVVFVAVTVMVRALDRFGAQGDWAGATSATSASAPSDTAASVPSDIAASAPSDTAASAPSDTAASQVGS